MFLIRLADGMSGFVLAAAFIFEAVIRPARTIQIPCFALRLLSSFLFQAFYLL